MSIRERAMPRVSVTARALQTVIMAAKTNRSNRLRRQGRIPKSDSDVKEAHRRTYQDNESLRSGSVSVESDEQTPEEVRVELVEDGPGGASTSLPTPSSPPDQSSVPDMPQSSRFESSDGSQNMSRAAVLIDILSASTADIDSTIAHHADSIDPELLHLLEGRIAAARQLEQDDETVKGLIALYHRLKSEYDRRTASPALRLLDTLISMMMAAEDEDEDEGEDEVQEVQRDGVVKGQKLDQRQSREDTIALVRARMQLAFDDSLSLDTDIFTVAQQLAVGERRFVDEMINEQVDAGEFIQEVEQLLKRAVEQQVAGRAIMASESDHGEPGERERLRQVLEQRERTIECVEELLVLARKVWLCRN